VADESNKPDGTGQTPNQTSTQTSNQIVPQSPDRHQTKSDLLWRQIKDFGGKLLVWAKRAFDEADLIVSGMNKRTLSWIAIGLAAIMLLSVNLISSKIFRSSSMDLTESALYTISASTKRSLAEIGEPIDVRVYFSEQLGEAAPLYKRYFDRVRGLLEQYSNISGGQLRVSFIEPEPFSDAEDRAVAAGLQGIRLNEAGDQGFFGLVATNSTDQQEIVPFFAPQRERYLEYDMTKLVHKLSVPKKLVIGVMSGLPVMGGMSPPRFPGQQPQPLPKWIIMEQIEEFFELKQLAPTAKDIPVDVDVLLLIQPAGLSEETTYAIDQFALSGKAVLAFIDPVPDIGRALNPMAGGATLDPQIAKLLGAWGVKIDAGKVAGDIRMARRVQTGGPQPLVTEYVTWLAVKEPFIADDDVISDGVKIINLSSTGFLEQAEKAATKLQPLLQTTSDAMEIPASRLLGQPDPVGLLRSYRAGGKQLTLAARLTGEIKTAFPDGKPKPPGKTDKAEDTDKASDKAEKKSTTLTTQLKTGKLNAVIVADSDLLYNDFWVQVGQIFGRQLQQPIASNAVFVINALENLSGGAALSGLGGRGVDERRFVTVDEIRRQAERRYREKAEQLKSKLQELAAKLSKVEQRNKDGGLALSEEDKRAIEEFRGEMVKTRKELRDLQHAMRGEIESLEGWLKFINIAVVPLLFGFGGMAFAAMRRRKAQLSKTQRS